MNNVDVSVIIPTYRMAEPLRHCLESIAAQEGVTIEVIVVDGAGDEETRTCIEPFKTLSIHHLTGPDDGVYDAMNKGVAMAQGNWLYFIGADDRLASPSVFNQLLLMAAPNADAVAGVVENLPPRHPRVPHLHRPSFGRNLLLRNTLHHQGCLYKRHLFGEYRYPTHFNVLGDYHLNLHLLAKHAKVTITDVHVASCSSDGLSKNFSVALYQEEYAMKRSILPAGSLWWQPFWLVLKYLRKRLSA